VAEAMAAATWQ